jgi:hypothetical protein
MRSRTPPPPCPSKHGPTPQEPHAKAGSFGFAVDNTIGATPQPNGWMDSWVDFYRERRIRHQLRLLGERGHERGGGGGRWHAAHVGRGRQHEGCWCLPLLLLLLRCSHIATLVHGQNTRWHCT